MLAVLLTINTILQIFSIILIVRIIFSWLFVMKIINPHSQLFNMIDQLLYTITEPILAPIRNILPNLHPIDLSPAITIFAIYLIEIVIKQYLIPMFVYTL